MTVKTDNKNNINEAGSWKDQWNRQNPSET